MMKTVWFVLALISVSFWSHAQDVSSATVVQSTGIDTSGVIGFIPKDGFFLAGDIGLFSSFDGYEDTAIGVRSSASMSSVNAFIGLTAGYDFSRNLGVGLKLANGSVSAGARSLTDLESPTDFGLYLIDGNIMGAVSMSSRLRLVLNGFGGLTVMSPPMIRGGSTTGFNAGATVGILYDTLLADMVVGLNVGGYAFMGFSGPADAKQTLVAVSISPVLKYVF